MPNRQGMFDPAVSTILALMQMQQQQKQFEARQQLTKEISEKQDTPEDPLVPRVQVRLEEQAQLRPSREEFIERIRNFGLSPEAASERAEHRVPLGAFGGDPTVALMAAARLRQFQELGRRERKDVATLEMDEKKLGLRWAQEFRRNQEIDLDTLMNRADSEFRTAKQWFDFRNALVDQAKEVFDEKEKKRLLKAADEAERKFKRHAMEAAVLGRQPLQQRVVQGETGAPGAGGVTLLPNPPVENENKLLEDVKRRAEQHKTQEEKEKGKQEAAKRKTEAEKNRRLQELKSRVRKMKQGKAR